MILTIVLMTAGLVIGWLIGKHASKNLEEV